ncbi:testis-expressed protein 36 isoform X2 [Mesocricetus auratus]|uniref:Testis-expressed protein 36 isoform X2 n=1 Tax=Mesocricetus auratus TaxID=10036 RepID=A0ABM2WKP1_MESAU|nr:testis-expressed protein 36 isoform X2 [Mesocricetus auratus]
MIVRSWRGEEANLSTSSFSEKMAKGRQFNPPLDKVGRWFPHVGLVQKTPESVTSTTLKEIRCPYLSQQLERKLPPIYKVREKGLGRKKISPDKRQHLSRNFNLWACDYIPSQCDGLSNNQTSYVHKEAAVISTFRRFPRCYEERWSAFKFVPNQSSTESLKNKSNKEFSVDTKAASPQEP